MGAVVVAARLPASSDETDNTVDTDDSFYLKVNGSKVSESGNADLTSDLTVEVCNADSFTYTVFSRVVGESFDDGVFMAYVENDPQVFGSSSSDKTANFNISVSSNTLSISKTNVPSAYGYESSDSFYVEGKEAKSDVAYFVLTVTCGEQAIEVYLTMPIS